MKKYKDLTNEDLHVLEEYACKRWLLEFESLDGIYQTTSFQIYLLSHNLSKLKNIIYRSLYDLLF